MDKRRFGNVRELPSGRWQARYRAPDGRMRSAPATYQTKREAERWLVLKEAEIAKGEWINPDTGKVTVADWGTRWLASVSPNLKPKTHSSYSSLMRTLIVPQFGGAELSQVRPIAVNEWIAGMTNRKLSPSRIRQAYRVFSQIMAAAVNNDMIKMSPCRGVKLPRLPETGPHILTDDEVRRLVVVARARPPHDLLVQLLVYVGLRIGEAFALRRGSIDLDGGFITVTEAISEIAGKHVFGTPKSHQSRTLKLPAFLVEALREHMATIGPEPEALLFTSSKGKPFHYNSWRTWYFDPAVEAADLTDVTPHDLRATHASWIADRRGIMAAANRMGHSNASVTTRHYARMIKGRDDEVANDLDADHSANPNPSVRRNGASTVTTASELRSQHASDYQARPQPLQLEIKEQ